MSDIKQELDRIRDRISDPSFLANKGLSNEVGIHVFCYDPADELIVRDFVSRLKAESGTPYHIKECDLYEIFLKLLEDKRVLKSMDGLEEKRGKEYLLKQLQKIATPEALLEYMKYEPHEYGDVLFLTGVGKIFPFMRSHKMLDSMQHLFESISTCDGFLREVKAAIKAGSDPPKVSLTNRNTAFIFCGDWGSAPTSMKQAGSV